MFVNKICESNYFFSIFVNFVFFFLQKLRLMIIENFFLLKIKILFN